MANFTSRCSSTSPLLVDSREEVVSVVDYGSITMADSIPGRYPHWFPTLVPRNSNLISALLVFSSCITSTVCVLCLCRFAFGC
jgi:hypothetical protein